jgi:hypothetical protein
MALIQLVCNDASTQLKNHGWLVHPTAGAFIPLVAVAVFETAARYTLRFVAKLFKRA